MSPGKVSGYTTAFGIQSGRLNHLRACIYTFKRLQQLRFLAATHLNSHRSQVHSHVLLHAPEYQSYIGDPCKHG